MVTALHAKEANGGRHTKTTTGRKISTSFSCCFQRHLKSIPTSVSCRFPSNKWWQACTPKQQRVERFPRFCCQLRFVFKNTSNQFSTSARRQARQNNKWLRDFHVIFVFPFQVSIVVRLVQSVWVTLHFQVGKQKNGRKNTKSNVTFFENSTSTRRFDWKG